MSPSHSEAQGARWLLGPWVLGPPRSSGVEERIELVSRKSLRTHPIHIPTAQLFGVPADSPPLGGPEGGGSRSKLLRGGRTRHPANRMGNQSKAWHRKKHNQNQARLKLNRVGGMTRRVKEFVLAQNRAPGGLLGRKRAQSTQKTPENLKIRPKTLKQRKQKQTLG